jgi:phage FluMu protein Com
MFIGQPLQFVHQVYPGNHTFKESRCPKCGVLIAAATEDKYLAIAEAVHKCRTINAPRLRREDLSRFH